MYDPRQVKQKKREKKNSKRRIKIDSVEYIISEEFRKKRQLYASCIYVFMFVYIGHL